MKIEQNNQLVFIPEYNLPTSVAPLLVGQLMAVSFGLAWIYPLPFGTSTLFVFCWFIWEMLKQESRFQTYQSKYVQDHLLVRSSEDVLSALSNSRVNERTRTFIGSYLTRKLNAT